MDVMNIEINSLAYFLKALSDDTWVMIYFLIAAVFDEKYKKTVWTLENFSGIHPILREIP